MATGDTQKHLFQAYVAQDHYFLIKFARAYELLEIKCQKEVSNPVFAQIAEAAREFRLGVNTELELHNSYANDWGVDSTSIQPTKTTLAYTDFLIQIAETEGPAEILAAMVPCARLYGYIGVQLALDPKWKTSPYANWVAKYSSADYLSCPTLKEQLLDRLVEGLRGNEGPDLQARLQALYSRAMVLELDFFMAHTVLCSA